MWLSGQDAGSAGAVLGTGRGGQRVGSEARVARECVLVQPKGDEERVQWSEGANGWQQRVAATGGGFWTLALGGVGAWTACRACRACRALAAAAARAAVLLFRVERVAGEGSVLGPRPD